MPAATSVSSMNAESTLLTPMLTTKAHSARVKPGTASSWRAVSKKEGSGSSRLVKNNQGPILSLGAA